MLNPGYYTENDLLQAGFKSVGKNVRIDKSCVVIGMHNISIGDNVRIDSFCCLISPKGEINFGSYIHIGSFCHLSGNSGIVMEDFSGLSQGVKIYSTSDDYTGKYLTNPMVPEIYTGQKTGRVVLKKHVIIGSNTVILPNTIIGEGSSVGAMSLVTKSLKSWGIYFGCPAKKLRERSREMLKLEEEFLNERKI